MGKRCLRRSTRHAGPGGKSEVAIDTLNEAAADSGRAAGPAVTVEERPVARSRSRAEALVVLGLLVILGLSAYFRFTGLSWDDNHHLHPDERFLTIVATELSTVDSPLDYLRTSVSTLNPYNFGETFYVYGNFPMTVTRYAAEWATELCAAATGADGQPPAWCPYTFTAFDGIHIVGRALSALIDLVSVFFTFLIARRLYGAWAGLAAAFLLGVAVMPIQQSHFFTMDNWAAAFTTVAIYAAVRAAGIGDSEVRWRLRWFVLFGIAVGLAAASRINILPAAVLVNLSAVIWLARRGHSLRSVFAAKGARDLERMILAVVVAAAATIFTFRLAMPYAFMDRDMVAARAMAETGEEPGALRLLVGSVVGLNPQFLTNMADIQHLQQPEASFPPALQWTDRPAILFPWTNMVLWGLGLTAGLFAWLATLWALWRIFQPERRWNDVPEWMLHTIPVAWTLLYFLFMGTRWVKSVRYFLPIYPTLVIAAGWALVYLWSLAARRDREKGGWRRAAVAGLAALVLVPSFLWATMFTQIYREPVTRVAASNWIFENVPSGATLLYTSADGTPRELQLPVKEFLFQQDGVPLIVDFQLPEDGTITGVRFNYLSDPDEGVDAETLSVQLNDPAPVTQVLELAGDRQAAEFSLPPTAASAGAPQRLTAVAGPGGPIRAGTSRLVNEHWDDLLPVSTGGRSAYGSYYTEVVGGQRPVTHPDSPEKREEVILWLDEADYIMLSSQRAMWSLPRLPLTYPMMVRYYEALFNGDLGFELVQQNHGNLRLGPLYVSDTTGQVSWGEPPAVGWPPPGDLAAEEAFSVYDHPPVWIFKKTSDYSSENTRRILESIDLSRVTVMNPLQATQAKNGLLLSPADAAAQRAGGTFDEVFNPDGLLSRNPWLAAGVWLVVTVLLGWLAFPLAFIALGGLPDRGYALSRVLGLLLLAYLPWLAASTGLLPATRSALLFALLVIIVASMAVLVFRRAALVAFVRDHAGYILVVELLGVALFALMVIIRLGNPDVWDVIWGGEKPMDLSYFTAVVRSTTFPPYDPWFAGGYINYYYWGFVLAGALTELLGIAPALAYNLVLPMLFSFTGVAVFSLAYNLVRAQSDADGEAPGPSRRPGWGSRVTGALRERAVVAGLVAVALALLVGNLAQVGVIRSAWYLTGDPALEAIPLVGNVARTVDGGIKALTGAPVPIYPGDWFWTASRAISASEGEVQPITEFPFFTFLYGDLHAHMISMPLTMLALGWAISLAPFATRQARSPHERGRRNWAELLLMWLVGALAIGALRATNTWDWPTYLLLGSLAALVFAFQQEGGFSLPALGRGLSLVVLLFGLSSLLFWPYSANYGSGYNSASLWQGSYTPAGDYLVVWGLFLFFVITHILREFRAWGQSWTDEGLRRLEPARWTILIALGLFVALNFLLLVRGYTAAPIVLPLLALTGLLALRPGLAMPRRITLALMAAALGLTLLVEIVVLDGDVGRMNTVFKFYLQAWLLLSVACGAAAAWAWPSIRRSPRLRQVWGAALAVLLAAALLYPLVATPAKWSIRMSKEAPNTLDGAAFLPYIEYGDTDYTGAGVTIRPGEDVEAIRWLQQNVEGSPVIAEAYGGNPYRSIAARIAMYTGLPTIIGWDWHQRQQRAVVPPTMVSDRIADVTTLYNTADIAQAVNILDRYDVGYVYVGTLEKAYSLPEGLAKFDQMAEAGLLSPVYQDAYARIFEVTR